MEKKKMKELPEGIIHTHIADDGTLHRHGHSDKEKKAVINRISRAIGSLNSAIDKFV